MTYNKTGGINREEVRISVKSDYVNKNVCAEQTLTYLELVRNSFLITSKRKSSSSVLSWT